MKLHDHSAKDLKRLKNHTLHSFRNDTQPLFDQSQRVAKKNGVFHFGIIREVMAYIEFCGAVYVGWSEEEDGLPDTRKVSNHSKSVKFITEVLRQVDDDYLVNGLLMYSMYRHGSTHLLRPHRVRSKKTGNLYSWRWYSGPREDMVKTDTGMIVPMKHMRVVKTGDVFELPLSFECLCNDVQQGIKRLFDDLIQQRQQMALPTPQRRVLSFIAEGIVERGDID